MLTAWQEHPPVPLASCLGTAALPQHSVPPKNGLFYGGTARGEALERLLASAAREEQLDNPGGGSDQECGAGSSSCSARHGAQPHRRASSWKSTGTDGSQPSLLREEPWHRVQTRIFPSPVSAVAQTADGIAQTLPSSFSPAIATLCSWIPLKTHWNLDPLCSRTG